MIQETRAGGAVVLLKVFGVIFAISALGLMNYGIPYLRQAPLRKRGVKTWAWEASRSVPNDGKIDVWYGYDGRDGGLHSIGMIAVATTPSGSQEVVYDPQNPRRVEFVSRMPVNVDKRRKLLFVLLGVALVSLILGRIGAMI